MSQINRVVTLKNNVEDPEKQPGFHVLYMGKEGIWVVDQEHPGYRGCIQKAMKIAAAAGKIDLVNRYSKLPLGKEPAKFKPIGLKEYDHSSYVEQPKINEEKPKKRPLKGKK